MVSLRALKNQGCISEHWPLPAVHAYGVTKKDDVEEDEEDDVIVPKQLTPERPIQPPFPFTEENIPKLKSWLANAFSTSSFNTSSAPMAKMSGPPMKIHVNPNAMPVAIHKPISIPHHWRAQVKADLKRDMKLGILEKVPMGVPTTWQSRMVLVVKMSGNPRWTVDLLVHQALLIYHLSRAWRQKAKNYWRVSAQDSWAISQNL